MLERVRGEMGRLVMAAGLLAGCGSSTGTAKSSADADVQENVVTQQPAETDSEDSASVTEETEDTTLEAENAETAGTEDTATEDTDAGSTGNTLIVYYSASGSTKAVAEKIAADTGAELFEITPVTPYTGDDLNWTNSDSRVSREHDDESLRDVELTQITPDNWDSYDTVLIGYPIWWGIAAWPVDNFVKGNDFTGKTVIPFCTSASSGLGSSGSLLEEMAGTGTWQEGHRFSSGASDSDVLDWVDTLDL